MPHYKYLIVGGGMTADAAVHGIREADSDGSMGLISAEENPPYNRPPLSKGLWKGEALEKIWRGTEKQNVTLHLGRQARSLDPSKKIVTDDQGSVYTFEKLLLATGATPRRLPFDDGSIIYFRTLGDYRNLRALTEHGRRAAKAHSYRPYSRPASAKACMFSYGRPSKGKSDVQRIQFPRGFTFRNNSRTRCLI